MRVYRFACRTDLRCPFCNNRDLLVEEQAGTLLCTCPDCRDTFRALIA